MASPPGSRSCSRSRVKLRLAIACVGVLASTVLGTGVAEAGTGVARSFSFSPGTGFLNATATGGFLGATAVGVNQSNGNVYVSDPATNSLWEFRVNLAGKSAEPEGGFGEGGFVKEPKAPKPEPELALPLQPATNGAGAVLAPTLNDDGEVREFDPRGEEIELANIIGGLGEPTGVGVDSSGNIYVALLGGAVREFNSAGKPVNAARVEAAENALVAAPSGVRAIAVDSSGEEIYLATEDGVIQYHLSAGAYVQGLTFGEGFTTGVAVVPPGGPAAGDVFVEGNGAITDYEPSGKQLTSFGQEAGHALGYGAARLAAYPTPTGAAIFAPNRGSVEVYETFPAPTPTAEPASEVQHSTATLNGTINPEGMTITSCYFEYAAGQRHACDLSGAEIGTGNAPIALTAKLEDLQPGASYPYHLVVVESEGHTITSNGLTLNTPPVATARTEAASSITTEAATLNATVDLLAGAGKYHFQYLQEGAAEPHTTGEKPLTAGEQTLTANLAGLEPNKLTFFRVVVTAEASLLPIDGEFEAFATSPVPPPVGGEPAKPSEALSPPGASPRATTPGPTPATTPPPEVKPPPAKSAKHETRAQRHAKEVKRCKRIRSQKRRAQCLRAAEQNPHPVAKNKQKK
jgi:hypothetical protein